MEERQGEWVAKWVMFLIVIVALVFVVDRAKQALFPKQYAAAVAEDMRRQEAEAAVAASQAGAAKAERHRQEVVEQQQLVDYTLATESFETAKRSLRDPQSAQFRDVWAVKARLNGIEIVAVCGVVNAKNAYGAYMGETPFVSVASLWTPDVSGFESVFRQTCLDGRRILKM